MILSYPNETLFTPTVPYDEFESGSVFLRFIINQMLKAMYEANGVGLSANQIGIKFSIFIMDETRSKSSFYSYIHYIFINPKIISMHGPSEVKEGCLSLRDCYSVIDRFNHVRLQWQDLTGNFHTEDFRGFKAQIIQHEMDHLNGKLFPDNMAPTKRDNFYKRFLKKSIANKQKS